MDNEIFAIDNELSTELIAKQNELNKAIYHHRALLNNKNGNNIIKAKILEKKIIQICEEQKIKFNGLRKERLKASNLDPLFFKQQQSKTNYQTLPKQYISNQTLLKPKNTYLNTQQSDKQLKSFNGPKLIIPNERMLVVSTPGGGARLVTTSTNTRPTISKSLNNNGFTSNSLLNNNKTQFNNFTITNTNKPIITTLPTNLNLQNSKILNNNNKSVNSNHLSTNELKTATTTTSTTSTTTNSNKRKSVIQPLIDRQEQLIIKKPKEASVQQQPILSEQEKLKQNENKIKEEYFSALGLLTKKALSEIQNKKSERKRRTTANPQFSSAAIEAKRNLALELAAKKAKKRELAASNQDKYLNQQPAKRSFLNSNNNNNRNKVTKQDNKKQVSKVPNKQSNNQLDDKQSILSINCFTCGDLCDSDLDEIGFCSDCRLLFHLYCATTVEKLIESDGTVPCPKCDRKKLLESNNNLNDVIIASNLFQKQKLESNSSTNSSIISKGTRRRKLSAQSKNSTLNNNNRINNVTQSKGNKVLNELSTSKLKSTIDLNNKDNDKVKLLIRHFEVIKLKRKYLEKIRTIKGQLIISKENKNDLLIKKEQTIKAIQTIKNLCGKIRDQKDNNEQKKNKEIVNEKKIELIDKLDNNLKKQDLIKDEIIMDEIDMAIASISN